MLCLPLEIALVSALRKHASVPHMAWRPSSFIPCPGRCLCLQVALASFAFLFSEFVQYSQSQVSNIGELERRWGPWLQPSLQIHVCAISLLTLAEQTTA